MGSILPPPLRLRRVSAPWITGLALVACLLAAFPAAGQTGSECTPSDTGICLLDDRFRVTVEWTDSEDNPFHLPGTPLSGEGMGTFVVPHDERTESGYFWFFEPDNVELIVKVVDGRDINGHFWVFYGATTNVEYTIRVVDTETDRSARYFNPQGEFGVGADTRAFEEKDELRTGDPAPTVGKAVFLPRKELPSCDDPTVTCLHDGRFAVESTFTFQDEAPRRARPVLTTPTSAILSHLNENDPDGIVKVVDGQAVNGRLWIFATILGRPDTEVVVTDLDTGVARAFYTEPESGILAIGDRNGFIVEPPAGPWMETPELPGFRFKTRITGGDGEVGTRQETECVPETLCVSGALPGRSELFLRMVGPKPNGYLWPNIVKFSTSRVEVWVEQLSTGQINYYDLEGATPGSDTLDGFFDRMGFRP